MKRDDVSLLSVKLAWLELKMGIPLENCLLYVISTQLPLKTLKVSMICLMSFFVIKLNKDSLNILKDSLKKVVK